MMRKSRTTAFAATLFAAVVAVSTFAAGGGAQAYAPAPQPVYSTDGSTCNKQPCILYPKTAQLPGGRIVASFERSEGPTLGQTMPVYKSDDNGDSWQKLTDIKPPSQLTTNTSYSKWTSNWTNAEFYVLPQAFGGMPAGTLLFSNVVSTASAGSNARAENAIILYASDDQGASWRVINTIATGFSDTADPVWEPFLMLYQGQLVAYYSDENDYLSYDPATGIPTLDPNNRTAQDSGGQVLVHKTWDGSSNGWSGPVIDVAGYTQDMGNGKTEIGGGRPGMTTVAPTSDGRWMMTFEYFGGGDNTRYKIADDPLKFFTVGDAGVSSLAVASGSGGLAQGGSPVIYRRPDGAIMFNAANSGDVWINESGATNGAWRQYHTSISGGYSRSMLYLNTTGQVLFVQAPWGQGPVSSAVVDFGKSIGTYYALVNRATGQVLAPVDGRTQDAQFTGNAPDIATQTRNDSNPTQWWHLGKKGAQTTLLNKGGGRALGIWGASASAGNKLAQWVDDDNSDKRWNLVRNADGYITLRAGADSSLAITASSNGTVSLATDTGAANQQWQLVIDFATTANSTFSLQNGSGKALAVFQASGADGARVVQWTSNGAADQSWVITTNSAGRQELTNRGSGKVLSVYNGSTSAGAQVVQWAAHGGNDQQWTLTAAGAAFAVKNVNSGLALGIQGGSGADGANAIQWAADSSANQSWQLVQTSNF